MDSRSRRPTAADFPPEVLSLFDRYVHGQLDRRGFLDGAARFAVGGTTAAGLLAALSPKFAQAQVIRPDDARIRMQWIDIASPAGHGTIRAQVVRPAQAAGPRPVVLVIHENRGLNPHIEDIARRFAVEGFVAVAPDALSSVGGYPGDEDAARERFSKLDPARLNEDFVAAARHALAIEGGNGRLGVVGFCYGGGVTNLLAARVPEIRAAAPFYGPAPAAALVPAIRARLYIVHAAQDERINAGWPAYEAALKAAGTDHVREQFAGTQHGFHNDTTPRFDAEAARQAWARTLALFNATLGTA
ncbi:MAG: carboxymethylenebutenolidase [Pseudomonadota bacterium]|nr:carboxymethylenebutenolidase [Pseudomonadota bacterium]